MSTISLRAAAHLRLRIADFLIITLHLFLYFIDYFFSMYFRGRYALMPQYLRDDATVIARCARRIASAR